MKSNLMGKVFLVLVVLVSYVLAWQMPWFWHLHSDTRVFQARSSYYWEHKNLSGWSGNEYQPGAVSFFMLMSPVLSISSELNVYIWSLFLVNLGCLGIMVWLYQRINKDSSLMVLGMVLLSVGPVWLFRFDLYVMIFLLASIYLWQQKKIVGSMGMLAWASLIKVFPVIFLPYFGLIAYKKHGFEKLMKVVGSYLGWLMAMVAAYMVITKESWESMKWSWYFRGNVPVNTESLWASLMSLRLYFTEGRVVKSLGAWGTFGVHPDDTLGSLKFYAGFSLVVLGVVYVYWFLKRKNLKFMYEDLVFLMVGFLLFSRTVHLQYTLWVLLLLPLLGKKVWESGFWKVNFGLLLLASLMFQYIYPTHFNQVLIAYGDGSVSSVFWINVLRNMLWIVVWVQMVLMELRPKAIK